MTRKRTAATDAPAAFVLSRETRPPRARRWRGSPDTSRRCRWMPNTARARVASRRRGISDSARWLSAASTWPPPPPRAHRLAAGRAPRNATRRFARAALAPLARCARAISGGATGRSVRVRRRRRCRRARARAIGVRGGCERDGRMGVRAPSCVRSPRARRPQSAADDERIAERTRRARARWNARDVAPRTARLFASGDGAACAVCDQPFRPVKVPGVV